MVFHGLTNSRREEKARKKRRSMNGNVETESEYSSDFESSEDAGDRPKYLVFGTRLMNRRRSKKRQSGKSDDFRTGIPYAPLTSTLTQDMSKDDEGRKESLESTKISLRKV